MADLPAGTARASLQNDLSFAPAILPAGRPSTYPQEVARAAFATSGAGAASTPLPPAARRRQQRRAVVLAGGVAAAVVAIVAITVGERSVTSPADGSATPPSKIAIVQSVDTSGRTMQLTVTAPVTTIAGALVALVQGADGSTTSLPVVAPRPTAGTTRPTGTATPTPTSADIEVGATSNSTSAGRTNSGSVTAPTTAPPPSAPVTTAPPTTAPVTTAPLTTAPVTTRSAGTASRAGAGGDPTATVITGLTTLTGWEPITTR